MNSEGFKFLKKECVSYGLFCVVEPGPAFAICNIDVSQHAAVVIRDRIELSELDHMSEEDIRELVFTCYMEAFGVNSL